MGYNYITYIYIIHVLVLTGLLCTLYMYCLPLVIIAHFQSCWFKVNICTFVLKYLIYELTLDDEYFIFIIVEPVDVPVIGVTIPYMWGLLACNTIFQYPFQTIITTLHYDSIDDYCLTTRNVW